MTNLPNHLEPATSKYLIWKSLFFKTKMTKFNLSEEMAQLRYFNCHVRNKAAFPTKFKKHFSLTNIWP